MTAESDLLGQLNLSPYLKIRIPQRDKCDSFLKILPKGQACDKQRVQSQPPEQGLHSGDDVSKIKGQRHAGVIHTPEGPVHRGLLGG